MHQFIKILLIIIVISISFWLINSKLIGNNSKVEKLIEEQDRLSTTHQSDATADETTQSSVLDKSQNIDTNETSQMITTAPIQDGSGMHHTLPGTEASEQGLGGIDHILTQEEREAMMEFAPEAGDDGFIGEAPESGDTGIYSDGPGGSDTIIGDGTMPGTSLEDSFNNGLQGESLEDATGIFGTPPEDSQP